MTPPPPSVAASPIRAHEAADFEVIKLRDAGVRAVVELVFVIRLFLADYSTASQMLSRQAFRWTARGMTSTLSRPAGGYGAPDAWLLAPRW
jgi:hypothetical protein